MNKAEIAKIDWLLANSYINIHQVVTNLVFQESKNILAQDDHDIAVKNNEKFIEELRKVEEFDDIPERLKNKILSEIEKPIEKVKAEMTEFCPVTDEQGEGFYKVTKASIIVALKNHPLIFLF